MIRNKVRDDSGNSLHYPACVPVRMRDNNYRDSAAPMLLSFVTRYEMTMLRCMRNYDGRLFGVSIRELYFAAVERCATERPTYYKHMPRERDFSAWIIAVLDNN